MAYALNPRAGQQLLEAKTLRPTIRIRLKQHTRVANMHRYAIGRADTDIWPRAPIAQLCKSNRNRLHAPHQPPYVHPKQPVSKQEAKEFEQLREQRLDDEGTQHTQRRKNTLEKRRRSCTLLVTASLRNQTLTPRLLEDKITISSNSPPISTSKHTQLLMLTR